MLRKLVLGLSKFLKVFKDMKTVKSWVRVLVTYAATAYIFGGGIWLMYVFLNAANLESDNIEAMKDIYMTIFPVATGIVTYWFATRSNTTTGNPNSIKQPEPTTGNNEESEANKSQGQKRSD